MRKEIQPQKAALPASTDLNLAQFENLQAECRGIAKLGGEAGKIAADMVRISAKLWELREKGERALGR